jgi:hypothetical protein
MVRVTKTWVPRVCQGDIYRDIELIEHAFQKGDYVEVSRIIFPLVVVLTQDCDLEQDYRVRWARPKAADQDKRLVSVLVAPLYNLDHVVAGEHLLDLQLKMRIISSGSEIGRLRSNQIARYHYLEFPKNVSIVPSVIDFKHYFAVSVEYLKRLKPERFVCKIGPLYRESVSQRFSAFLSRIGLPDPRAPRTNATPRPATAGGR